MSWVMYKRPEHKYRKILFPAVNINRGGFFLNWRACQLIGLDDNNERWVSFLHDPDNPNRFGFRFWKSKQESIPEHSQDLYKVTYREQNRSAKIYGKYFLIDYKLLEKALAIRRTTFPLLPDESQVPDSITLYFEIKEKEDDSNNLGKNPQ